MMPQKLLQRDPTVLYYIYISAVCSSFTLESPILNADVNNTKGNSLHQPWAKPISFFSPRDQREQFVLLPRGAEGVDTYRAGLRNGEAISLLRALLYVDHWSWYFLTRTALSLPDKALIEFIRKLASPSGLCSP